MKALAAVCGYLGLFLILVSILFFASKFPDGATWNKALWIGFLVVGVLGLIVFAVLRWRSILEGMTGRSSIFGLNMALVIVVVLAIVVFVNLISINHPKRFDLTANGKNSLSEGTTDFLSNLVNDATVYYFFNTNPQIASQVQNTIKMLDNFKYATDHVKVVPLNTDDQPDVAAQYNLTGIPAAIVKGASHEETVEQIDEESIVNAIVKTTRDKAITVFFTSGHREVDLSQNPGLMKEMEKFGYNVQTIQISQGMDTVVPGQSVLVTMLPREEFLDSEIALLGDYLDRGGRYFLALAPAYPGISSTTKIREFLGNYGIDAPKAKIAHVQQVVDFGLFKGVQPMVLGEWDKQNPITRKFTTAQLQINQAQPFKLAAEVPPGVQVTSLIESTDDYWADTTLVPPSPQRRQAPPDEFDSATDIPGPVSVAIAATKKGDDQQMRLVAIGDLQDIYDFNGGALFYNIINWLGDQGDLITVERPQQEFVPVLLTKQQLIFVYGTTLFGFPVLALAIGIIVVTLRRTRAS